MKIFCISVFNKDYNKLKNLNLIPVGLGKKSLVKIGYQIKGKKIFQRKILTLENIPFTLNYGKIKKFILIIIIGLVFVLIDVFGLIQVN